MIQNQQSSFDLSSLDDYQIEQKICKHNADLELMASQAPHLFKHKFYTWSREVFESENRKIFLCAGNQSGKSTVMIMKNIDWLTDVSKRAERWPKMVSKGGNPTLFWYFYPDKDTIAEEVDTKWVPLLLCDDKHRSSPYYAKLIPDAHSYKGIDFPNVDGKLRFKTYNQKRAGLQSRTVAHATFDEEPELRTGEKNIFNEVVTRLSSNGGYLLVGFTAIYAQDFFAAIMEDETSDERYKNACKVHATLYDCREYEDGTPGYWTDKEIEDFRATLTSDAEIQKRINGRFVKGIGTVYNGYNTKTNRTSDLSIGGAWDIYGSVDVGSGGDQDAAAVIFLAISPDGKKAKVVGGWKGEYGIETSSGDILKKYISLRDDLIRKYKRSVSVQVYDHSSKEFEMVSRRAGEIFHKANKKRDDGVQTVNTLFKNNMLLLCALPELQELEKELCNYIYNAKGKRVKDFCDALRYAVMAYGDRWDFSVLKREDQEVNDINEGVLANNPDDLDLQVGIGNHPDNIHGIYGPEDYPRLVRKDKLKLRSRGYRRPGEYEEAKSVSEQVIEDYKRNLSENYGIYSS